MRRPSRRGALLAAGLLLPTLAACAAPPGPTAGPTTDPTAGPSATANPPGGGWEGAPDPLAFGGPNGVQTARPVPAEGAHGMVVSAQRLASAAGADILERGGNAVDAAVAVAYALAVVFPAAGNIGGGGFMTLLQPDGTAAFLDFREHAPLAATATMYQDAQGNVVPGLSENGWKAVAVPGTVRGMDEALRRWGSMPRAAVMAPAIRLARDGFVLAPGDVMLLRTSTDGFRRDPALAAVFLHADGTPLDVGDRLVQPDLAATLQRISDAGPDAFYRGPTAAAIVAASAKGGGILSDADFARYRTRVLPPITCGYHGYTVYTAPPPSGGGVALCEMLGILDGEDLSGLGLRSTAGVQRQVEAMRRAFADRQNLGDPDFVHDDLRTPLSAAYAAAVRAHTATDRATPSAELTPDDPVPHPASAAAPAREGAKDGEGQQTTHFSIVDKDGRAVALTYTLNAWFGAKVMAPGTGVVLNDEMDDFSSKPGAPNMFGIVGSAANAIAPGKTPLSSMSPTILAKGGHAFMVTGSPGGSRIPTITLASILGVLDGHLDVAQAVNAPRIHEQWTPSAVQEEHGALSDQVVAALTAMGYRIEPHESWGSDEAILVGGPSLADRRPGVFGGLDLRHPGGAAIGE